MAAMVEAVARINSTDSASGRGGIIRIEPQRVAIDTPLTVSRLVGITFARKDGQTAGVKRTSFGVAPTVTVESRMKAADTADGWRDDEDKARTVQFNLAQALPQGQHTLDFDRPIGPTALFLAAWWHVWGPDRIEVGYHGFGTVRETAPIAFVPSWAELGGSCARLAAMVALALWAVIAAIQFARAPRFSKLSVASIRRRGQPIEAREPLRRWDARGNWRTVWGALLCRRLPARTEVEGLLLEATQGGPRLLLVGTSETIKIESDGRTVQTIREESPRLHFIPLSWNSTFSDRRLFETLTLKRS